KGCPNRTLQNARLRQIVKIEADASIFTICRSRENVCRSRENVYDHDCSPRQIDVTRHLRLAHLANALACRRRLGSKAKEVRLRVDLGHSCVEGCVSPASDLLSLSRFTFVVMASDAVPYCERRP
ncbi:unnamed protein product, partial [Ixodes persulcatus]